MSHNGYRNTILIAKNFTLKKYRKNSALEDEVFETSF